MSGFVVGALAVTGFFAALAVVSDMAFRWCKDECDRVLGEEKR